ncbi:nucleotide pyrophosphatase [Metallosphaera tengchongensis]|uniref:Nucleotide pyrophosphatase n=1 Tax=Metallosphaera tengchongensis TaxID=1532350 RepID=A0A6N0NUX1_9CREN|nr:alkaline phosphatase family protein [Metallosphaera tengchongensis]QKQ99974.1 nucleotide pyrophosphatase [Metallosphaera tengchongensis]
MKILLIVIDGLSFHLMERFRYNLPTFQEMEEEGVYGSLESSYPSITPVALASLFTGFNPKTHGVVAPRIFIKGRKIQSSLSAFSSNSLLVDPIWSVLGKKGFKVVVTSAPQALPDRWELDNVVLFDPYKAKVKKCSESFVLKPGENEVLGGNWVVKKTDGGHIVTIEGKEIELKGQDWIGPLEIKGKCGEEELLGTVFLHNKEEGVYVTQPAFLNYKWGNRRELVSKVWENVVKKVGMILDGDYRALNKGLISFEEYLKTVDLAFNFFVEYSLYVLKLEEWDFGITYLPIVDNLQHLLYGIDDGRAFESIFNGYKIADRFVMLHRSLADNIFVCSDHGITKIKKRVYINKILERLNVLKIENGKINWGKTKAFYGGGGIIRVNLREREEAGVVNSKEYQRLVRYIVKNLEEVKDESGETIFTGIYMRDSPAVDRQGDIELSTRDFFSLSSNTEHDNEIESVKPYVTTTGDHGYYRKEDLYGIIIASGNEIAKGKKIKAKIVDVAPTILKIMGIQNSKTEGRVLVEALRNGSQEQKTS